VLLASDDFSRSAATSAQVRDTLQDAPVLPVPQIVAQHMNHRFQHEPMIFGRTARRAPPVRYRYREARFLS
jgi:hypothetical protein